MQFSKYTSLLRKDDFRFCNRQLYASFFKKPCSVRSFHCIFNSSISKASQRKYVYCRNTNDHTGIRFISTSPFYHSPSNYHDSVFRVVAESNVVYKVQDALIAFHDFSGFSWWTTVIVSALTVRTLLILPLAIHQHYVAAKLEEVNKTLETTVKKEVTKTVNKLSDENNWNSKMMNDQYRRLMRERRHEMIIENNCHPAKTVVLVLIQAPVWIILSSALRNLIYKLPSQDLNAEIVFLQMKASNFLWLCDLTAPDTTWTIPVCFAITNLLLIQVNVFARKRQKGLAKLILMGFRCFSIFMAYISSTVPSMISLYWLTSSCYGLCQNSLLMTPKIRKLLGIPITDSVRKNPFQYLVKKIKGIIYFFKY